MFSGFGFSGVVASPSYYFLVEFVVGLSFFIIVWIFVVMACQVWFHSGVSPTEGENNPVELAWTFIPSIFVFFLSVFNLGCFGLDGSFDGCEVVKVVGRQWYWSYGLSGSDFGLYDSVMGDFIDEVDKPLRLVGGLSHCFNVTSADVIHSFSVPFLRVKVDAIPGRINQFPIVLDSYGRHVGYCTELCGAGHAYMPVVVEVVPPLASLC